MWLWWCHATNYPCNVCASFVINFLSGRRRTLHFARNAVQIDLLSRSTLVKSVFAFILIRIQAALPSIPAACALLVYSASLKGVNFTNQLPNGTAQIDTPYHVQRCRRRAPIRLRARAILPSTLATHALLVCSASSRSFDAIHHLSVATAQIDTSCHVQHCSRRLPIFLSARASLPSILATHALIVCSASRRSSDTINQLPGGAAQIDTSCHVERC